jgi:hypothetical protein
MPQTIANALGAKDASFTLWAAVKQAADGGRSVVEPHFHM